MIQNKIIEFYRKFSKICRKDENILFDYSFLKTFYINLNFSKLKILTLLSTP